MPAAQTDAYTFSLNGITIRHNGVIIHHTPGFTWENMDYAGMQLLQNTIYQSVLALGNARAAESVAGAAKPGGVTEPKK